MFNSRKARVAIVAAALSVAVVAAIAIPTYHDLSTKAEATDAARFLQVGVGNIARDLDAGAAINQTAPVEFYATAEGTGFYASLGADYDEYTLTRVGTTVVKVTRDERCGVIVLSAELGGRSDHFDCASVEGKQVIATAEANGAFDELRDAARQDSVEQSARALAREIEAFAALDGRSVADFVADDDAFAGVVAEFPAELTVAKNADGTITVQRGTYCAAIVIDGDTTDVVGC